jgi:hypothetical protein
MRRYGDARDARAMTAQRALHLILAVAIGGAAFSGYLSWRELAAGTPGCEAIGATGTVLGYPPCVYGLAMYAVLAGLAAWGLRAAR